MGHTLRYAGVFSRFISFPASLEHASHHAQSYRRHRS